MRPLAQAKKRWHLLILTPSLPSRRAARAERTAVRTLAALGGHYKISCIAEDMPLSVRLDEAELAHTGVNLPYSFSSPHPEVISARLREFIATASPALDAVGITGLAAMRRHLLNAKLFAPGKDFFAVLGRADVAALSAGSGIYGDKTGFAADSRLLSCCDHVFCETGEDAQSLRRLFHIRANKLENIHKVLSARGSRMKSRPLPAGTIYMRRARAAAGIESAFEVGRKVKARDYAGANAIILATDGALPSWLAINRPFSACSTLWSRLKDIFSVFPDAGMILPSVAAAKSPAHGSDPRILLEAASLNGLGKYSEPLLLDDMPLALLRTEAFKRVGGFDTRFSDPRCAWTDLALRMRQAGSRVITVEDAVISSPAEKTGNAAYRMTAAADMDLLVHKWCAEGLRTMELLVSELGGKQP